MSDAEMGLLVLSRENMGYIYLRGTIEEVCFAINLALGPAKFCDGTLAYSYVFYSVTLRTLNLIPLDPKTLNPIPLNPRPLLKVEQWYITL